MKVQYYTATTLDGFIADPEHSLDWLLQFEAPESSYPEFIEDVTAVVMGSSTYRWLLEHHVYQEPERPKPWPYEQPAWVFTTRSLRPVEGADIRFVEGDVAAHFPAMRDAAGDGNLWVAGGGDLAGQFHDAGLLDEIIVQIAPVTLGGGMPVFPRRVDRPPLVVTSVTPWQNGMVEIRYRAPYAPG